MNLQRFRPGTAKRIGIDFRDAWIFVEDDEIVLTPAVPLTVQKPLPIFRAEMLSAAARISPANEPPGRDAWPILPAIRLGHPEFRRGQKAAIHANHDTPAISPSRPNDIVIC